MAKISLRAYNREIETMIDSGHTDEAIAHSRYILKKYPKHIDSYRLLGKAYLEKQRYSDASDIMQRVLSSVPDDFVAHLGMSIIREDEGNLDAAIWHMERAFEVQPSNAAIQAELKRLYGRRDGLEPPKIHLTRGALARMYAKGNLHRQAIAELRAALAEEPRRPDLLVLLARMYQQTGQRVEAVETCSNLLRNLPYCSEANLLLAKILPKTERASEAKIYRQRVETLDPYAAHTSDSHPAPEDVPDSAVMLEKYEWTPGESLTDPTEQPEWATSLGVEIGEEGESDVPDWLAIASEGAQDEDRGESGVVDQGTPAAEGTELPDWLSEGEDETPSQAPPASDFEDEIAPGEVPDWLQAMAPTGEAGTEGDIEWDESEAFDWLEEEKGTAEGEAQAEEAAEVEPAQAFDFEPEAEAEIPDWLRELDEEKVEEPYDEGVLEPEKHEPSETQVPEWLASDAETGPGDEEEIPGWLQDMGADASAEMPEEELPQRTAEAQMETGDMELEEASEAERAEFEPSEEEIPDWLLDEEEEEVLEAAEIPDWLQELEPDEAEAEAEAPEGLEAAEVPELLQDLEPAEAGAEEEAAEAIREVEAKTAEPAEGIEIPPEAEIESLPPEALQDEEAALAWLESLAEKQGAAEEELLTSKELRSEEPPEWLQELAEEEAEFDLEAEAPAEEALDFEAAEVEAEEEPYEQFPAEEAEEEVEIPDWLQAAQAEELSPEEAEELPDWMHAAEEGPPPKGVEALVEEQSEVEELEGAEIPEWLQEATEEEAEGALPDWLADLDADLDEKEIEALEEEGVAASIVEAEVAAEHEGEIPDWLQDLGEADQVEPELEVEMPEPAEAEPAFEPGKPILGDTQPVRAEPEEEETKPVDVDIEEQEQEIEAVEAEWAEVPEAQEGPFEGVTAGAEEIAEDEIPVMDEMEVSEEMDEESAMAWLEGLAAEQGAAEEEMVTAPEERLEAPPEWVYAMETEEEVAPEPEPAEVEIPEEPAEVFEAEEIEEEEPVEPEFPVVEPVAATELRRSETTPEPEIAEVEPEVEVEEIEAEVEEIPAEVAEPEPPQVVDINMASMAELERIPGIGFTTAQNIIAYRETYGPLTSLDQLESITGIGPVSAEELKNWLTIEEQPEVAPEPEDPQQAALIRARAAMSSGDVSDAVAHYEGLIKEQSLLDEIVVDLEAAIERHPVDIELYQALGDAYMRLDQLDKALDTYTRAEELLS